jgi:hypothetical protein
MEEGPDPKGKKANQPFSWLPQIDQVLVVGMKYGPKGTHDAVNKLRQLVPELSPAQIWHRMRHLRKKDRGQRIGPIDWSEEALETLREGYRSGGRKKADAIKTVRALYPGLSGYVVSKFARSQLGNVLHQGELLRTSKEELSVVCTVGVDGHLQMPEQARCILDLIYEHGRLMTLEKGARLLLRLLSFGGEIEGYKCMFRKQAQKGGGFAGLSGSG